MSAKNRPVRWEMRLRYTPLLIFIFLAALAGIGQAQIMDDPNYKIIVPEFRGLPGTIVNMPIMIKNYDTTHTYGPPDYKPLSGTIGSFLIRFEYNKEYYIDVEPLLKPVIKYVQTNAEEDTTEYYFDFEMVGRGDSTFYRHKTDPNQSYYPVWVIPDPVDNFKSDVIFAQFLPSAPQPEDYESLPLIPASPESSVVMLIPFEVNPDALEGESTVIEVRNDEAQGDYRINMFSDSTGLFSILPDLRLGNWYRFIVGDPINNAPTVTVPSASYSVSTGELVSFTVSADDIDADSVWLTAIGLPSGATFSPSNPVVGKASVSGTFSWTPLSAGTFTVQFQADDKEDTSPTINVTITVSGGGGDGTPVIGPMAPSYDVMQGESVTFPVSASDPDGDHLCLAAENLPPNAEFTPENPVCAVAAVSGTFSWTPSFSQSGNFTVIFRASDEGGLSSAKAVTIFVEKLDVDRLYTTSTYGGWPEGGIPGATPVLFPIDLASIKTVYGIQFDMTFPGNVAELDSIVVTDRMPEYVVYDNIGQYRDSVRIVAFGLNNEPIESGTTTAIMHAYFSMDTAGVPGDYWVHFYDAWESIDPDPTEPSLFLVVDSGIIQVDMMGDVNLDKRIDVGDVVSVVGYIIGRFSLAKRHFETANIVQDTLVNVVDLVGIINMIFGIPVNPSPAPPDYGGAMAKLGIEHDDLSAGQYTKLNVRGEFPDDVAGIQLQIDYDPGAVRIATPEIAAGISNFGIFFNDDHTGRMKVLIYSRAPWEKESIIPAGLADVVNLTTYIKTDIDADDDTKIKITRAYLSNPAAGEIPIEGDEALLPSTFTLYQNYPNPFNPYTTIEFEIGHQDYVAQHVELNVYNILGRRVKTLVDDELTPGRHSVTWDATDNHGARVATGIYLYRLEVGSKAESKKMLLLK
jgi:hypothetical protein